jgi:soluble lytic murein transglycosylase
LARSYERLGDSAAALHLYGRARELSNLGYYGQRAAQAEGTLSKGGTGTGRSFFGIDFLKVTAAVSAIQAGGRSHLTAPGESAARVIERARQLLAADLPDLAVSELRSAIALLPEERSLSYVLSRMFERRGDPYNAIVTLRRAFPDYDERPHRSLPPEVWELLFPLRHWETIVANATKNSLDPHLVLGIIRQESAFQVAARSRANARGLMQVLPSTGRMLARDAGVGRYTVSKLFRPEANIALGTRYLASLMERFGGRLEISLAAYNAGGSRAERWQAEFGHLDMAEFVERIPFSETRGYVKQVLTNMAHYSHLTSPSSSPGQ